MEGGDSLTRTLVGGLRGNCTPDQISVDVLVRGTTSLQAAPAVVTLTLRKLGDVDGDGLVNASDKLEINKKLNGLSTLPGIELRNLDLSGDGVLVNAEDKLAINQVLNGLAVP